jgi:hypothetical protein
MTDPAGIIIDCAGNLDSGLTIAANRTGPYQIRVSRSTDSVIASFSIAAGPAWNGEGLALAR